MIDNETGELVLFFYPVRYGRSHGTKANQEVPGFYTSAGTGMTDEDRDALITKLQTDKAAGKPSKFAFSARKTPRTKDTDYAYRLKFDTPREEKQAQQAAPSRGL